MNKFLSALWRYMPLLFLVMVVIGLVEFWSRYGPGWGSIVHGARAAASYARTWAWTILTVALALWIVVIFCHLYEAGRLRIPQRGGWMKDILDRLTNKRALEEKIAQQADVVYVNAEALAGALKSRLIGQDDVCEDLAAQIRRRSALQQRGKPIGVFLFAGPPGTGKTYLAKRLAAEMDKKLLHLDMSQFSRGSSAATQLFGMSRGYVGSDTYGKLTAVLRDVPDSIILLDEFEKAHPEVHKNFLTAWNDGFITEASDGAQISTTRAVFVLTTNAATDALSEMVKRYATEPEELRKVSVQVLREAGFAPEVLSRIDRIFVFRPLKGLDIARVGALEIEEMIHGYGLEVADGGIDVDVLYDLIRRQEKMGSVASSRDLVRRIEETIADSLVSAKQQKLTKVRLMISGDTVSAEPAA
ncbi:MAG: AAA family ATPase [Betaproteobacteria bacterium]|nr:AAA family ATPase [Betaproteobacteria bacterium]